MMILSLSCFCYSQDITCSSKYDKHNVHSHEYFTVCYNTDNYCPNWVQWTLTDTEAIEAENANNRASSFTKCKVSYSAVSSDYTSSGYDRGHMCPNNDRDFSEEAAKTTFKMCNVCPQLASLNRGCWKSVEELGHIYAKKFGSVKITCGPIFEENSEYINSKIRVPVGFFKIFYVEGVMTECYIFHQEDKTTPQPTTIEAIEDATGLKFSFN